MDQLMSKIIGESNLTMLQACAYSIKGKSDFDVITKNKFLKKKSGEKSTIKKQAVNNLKKSLYSLIWLYMEGYLEKKDIINLLDTIDNLRDLVNRNHGLSQDSRLIEGLELIIRAIVDKR